MPNSHQKVAAWRETSDPLGKKLVEMMDEAGLEPSGLAKVFKVKPPSVYTWIRHGRLAKKHLRKLREWSGRSLDWWFDAEVEGAPPSKERPGAMALPYLDLPSLEPAPAPAVEWPFERISPFDWSKFTPQQKMLIEGFALGVRAEAEGGLDGGKSRGGARGSRKAG